MVELHALESYSDENGNVIVCDGRHENGITVRFRGRNNRIEVAPDVEFKHFSASFDCDNGVVVIGRTYRGSVVSWDFRIGQDSTVRIGNLVTTTSICFVSAVEGATVTIGNDVMISSTVKIRSDDAHPIFDVRSGRRVNPAKDVSIGNHVWLGWGVSVLAGARIRAGSVIGTGAIVTSPIPNNCIAAGIPAKVIRRDVAWERPHLSLTEPPYKPDISTIRKTERFWNLTKESSPPRVSRLGRLRKLFGPRG